MEAQNSSEARRPSGIASGKKHVYKPIPKFKGCKNC